MRPITVLLTLPVVVLLTQPLWAPEWGAGILAEVAALGVWGALAAVAAFFRLVALYCGALQRLLAAVPAEARRRSPRSVWLMFAIPLNFVEYFFIVADVGHSLAGDGRVPSTSLRVWTVVGTAWCALQLVSLLPRPIGIVGGALAVALWLAHWAHTLVLLRRL